MCKVEKVLNGILDDKIITTKIRNRSFHYSPTEKINTKMFLTDDISTTAD
jgi:hypothetical protein